MANVEAGIGHRPIDLLFLIMNRFMRTIAPKLYEDIQKTKFVYDYCFTVPQLIFLCQCIKQVKDIKGAVAEVGVFQGHTTIFLNKYMDAEKIDKKYYAIDTFSGFVPEDIEYEVSKRQKNASQYTGWFKTSKTAFDTAMSQNAIKRVVSIQADVNNYDLTSLGPISFVLLDVDFIVP